VGTPLMGYIVCRSDTGACQTLPATALTTTFDLLQRKTSYTFTVRATNSAGTGASTSVTARTK
jgi:hypothetical protein